MSFLDLFRRRSQTPVIIDPGIQFDPLFQTAVDDIYRTGNPSAPALQKRLKIGYARATLILDQMEAVGLVGPFEGAKPRKMLMSKRRWLAIRPQCTASRRSRIEPTVDDSINLVHSTCSEPSVSVCNSSWLTYGGIEAELLNVDLMEGSQFELWCAALLRENGFVNVQVTRYSGDAGVDILAEKDSIKYAIQCKRYTENLGNTPIQEIHAGKAVYGCHVGAVMTNQYFTEGGKRVAAATGTLLWDRDWLRAKIAAAKSTSLPTVAVSPLLHEEIESDKLFSMAVDIFLETGQPSVSMLQRRLKLGYARAAQIVDEMEEKGIIGPFRGSKPRKILITKKQWEKQKFQ